MSLIESAPATIPATSVRIFAVAFAPPFTAIWHPVGEQRRQPAPRGQRHHRDQPAHDTRFRIIESHAHRAASMR